MHRLLESLNTRRRKEIYVKSQIKVDPILYMYLQVDPILYMYLQVDPKVRLSKREQVKHNRHKSNEPHNLTPV